MLMVGYRSPQVTKSGGPKLSKDLAQQLSEIDKQIAEEGLRRGR